MRAPMPPRAPLLGHARALARDPLRTLLRWMEDYGPVVRFRVGSRDAHVVFGPEGIRRVLSDPAGIYGKDTHGYRALRLFLGDGLLTSEGDRWVRHRRILQPAFHQKAVARQIRTMDAVAARWAERLGSTGEPVRVDEIAMRTTLEVVTRTLFGTDLGASAADVADAITDLQVAANRRITAAVTLPFSAPTPEHLRIRRARRRLRRLLARLVAERRRAASGACEEPDVIDLLLAARDGETGAPLPPDAILDELVTLLIAGHESTANALTWALTLLTLHPAELALVREELDRTAERAELPRLRAAIDETLRLYPPAWSFGRAPREDDEIAGYAVPAGHLIMIVPWATHRSRAIFEHPEAFAPSRFLRGAPPPFSYLPFGAGPRTCIGHTFARVEIEIVLARWLRTLDFELVVGQELEPLPLVTLRPRSGVRMRVTPRSR
jgi:cytochrome P450